MKADFPTDQDFAAAAARLGCEVAAIRAVAEVEAGPEGAFLPSGEPVILFERHVFYRLVVARHGKATAESWRRTAPNVCNPKRGGYGPVSRQHARLQVAAKLDREAALRSTSWGLFQILADNCEECGLDLQEFVNAAYRSVGDHLRLFVSFIEADRRLLTALLSRDWATLARIYNGPAYAEHHYDTRIAAAFERLSPVN